MKLTILGSGSPEAYSRRASSGYLLEVGDDKILFDCGGGVVDRLLQAGYQPSDITHLFFSHLHSDHMMDYALLVHAAWDEGGAPLKVFGPPAISEITEKLFGPDGVFSHDLQARTQSVQSQEVWVARGGTLPRPWPKPQIFEIDQSFEFSGGGWVLQTCAVPHAQPHLDCFGFTVEAEDKKFAYSGDAGLSKALKKLIENADVLLHWCYRLDGEKVSDVMARMTPTPIEIAEMAKRCGVKKLLLTHFRKHMDVDFPTKCKLYPLDPEVGTQVVEDLDVFEMD